MFKDAKVGDRVVKLVDFATDCRIGQITHICTCGCHWPLTVVFSDDEMNTYSLKGQDGSSKGGKLYSLEHLSKEPPLPKPKREVIAKGWVNLYPQDFLATKELADKVASEMRLGEAVHILHKYKEG